MKIFRMLASAAGLGGVVAALVGRDQTAKLLADALPKQMLEQGVQELAMAQGVVSELDRLHGMVAELADVLVVVEATSDISVVDRPDVAAFLAGESFLTRLVEAHLLCKTNDLSEVRFRDVPLQWGDDLFRDREKLPSGMGEVVVDQRGDFWFCDNRRNDNGQVQTEALPIARLVAKVIDHQSDRLAVMSDNADAVTAFARSRARFKLPGGFVIWSESEGAFWSNETGWSSLDEADVFTVVEKSAMALPLSSGSDASWMKAADAEEHAACSAMIW
jgi:hypothetical protein